MRSCPSVAFSGWLRRAHDPWSKLTSTQIWVATARTSPRTNCGARAFSRNHDWDWNDRNREQELHDHYRALLLAAGNRQ
jgi:hypothetical protein